MTIRGLVCRAVRGKWAKIRAAGNSHQRTSSGGDRFKPSRRAIGAGTHCIETVSMPVQRAVKAASTAKTPAMTITIEDGGDGRDTPCAACVRGGATERADCAVVSARRAGCAVIGLCALVTGADAARSAGFVAGVRFGLAIFDMDFLTPNVLLSLIDEPRPRPPPRNMVLLRVYRLATREDPTDAVS